MCAFLDDNVCSFVVVLFDPSLLKPQVSLVDWVLLSLKKGNLEDI